ncbi:MAG: hypothetical protein M1569_02040 [Candidatus Marsarchaeota archaeon]|nr:hypothetical protein [Candidatus Marsarchaeota archaeon]MCL5413161.1 hypothetical protein [Candidatus Marsarchaeota archaeon]
MELPEKIREALGRIRNERSHYVDIKIIGGRCYVYESISRWDKERRKVKKIARYIGKITENGTFIESRPRSPGLEAAIIRKPDRKRARQGIDEETSERKKYDEQILKVLSKDGRAPVAELGKAIGLGNTAADAQRNNIEKRYGVRYAAEIDISRLGYLTYFVFIKFEDKRPSISLVKRELEKVPNIQLAMLTYGKYDIIMYVAIYGNEEVKDQLYNIRNSIFVDYDLKLYLAPFYQGYGFVPLRDAFFDMLSSRVWTRSAQRPRPAAEELLMREYAVLKELSENGKEDFTSIDKKYRLADGSARYTYHRLVEKGVIKRITIYMQSLQLKYISAIFLNKINQVKYRDYRPMILQHIINDFKNSAVNKYALEGDIKMPEGVFFLMPVLSDSDVVAVDDELKRVHGTEVDSLIVTNMLVGSLGYRKLDKKMTNQYAILKSEYGIGNNEG